MAIDLQQLQEVAAKYHRRYTSGNACIFYGLFTLVAAGRRTIVIWGTDTEVGRTSADPEEIGDYVEQLYRRLRRRFGSREDAWTKVRDLYLRGVETADQSVGTRRPLYGIACQYAGVSTQSVAKMHLGYAIARLLAPPASDLRDSAYQLDYDLHIAPATAAYRAGDRVWVPFPEPRTPGYYGDYWLTPNALSPRDNRMDLAHRAALPLTDFAVPARRAWPVGTLNDAWKAILSIRIRRGDPADWPRVLSEIEHRHPVLCESVDELRQRTALELRFRRQFTAAEVRMYMRGE